MAAESSFDEMADFTTLMNAHRMSRRGKQGRQEVVRFEMNLSSNLVRLSNALLSGEYRPLPYFHFTVSEPKVRQIYAPRYQDRVVQRALCDTMLRPTLEPRLIYDNAACRVGKGTHFALDRLSRFMDEFHRAHGFAGYVLRADVRSYFASIRHDVLLKKLGRVFSDSRIMPLMELIVGSYKSVPGVGLPLGNQASQWFALYYMDGLDRLVKERLGIRWYTRYMDDLVLLHPSKAHLQECLRIMKRYCRDELGLEFNEKTQIFPISAGIRYLGWRTYLSPTGGVVRRLDTAKKKMMAKRIYRMQKSYAEKNIELRTAMESLNSYRAHLAHGQTFHLMRNLLGAVVLRRT